MLTLPQKALLLLMAVLGTTGCAHHSIVVKCDGKLEPINLPEAKAADTKAAPPLAPPAN